MKLLQLIALIWVSFTIFPANADIITVTPVMVDVEGTNTDIYETYNENTGETGELIIYDYDGVSVIETTTNEE